MKAFDIKKLEFDKIKEQLITFTMSSGGRVLAERLQPSTDEAVVKQWLKETDEAAALLQTGKSVPLSAMEGVESLLRALDEGRMCNERELERLAGWLNSTGQMKRYLRENNNVAPTIGSNMEHLQDFPALREQLELCIRNGELTDHASAALANARKQIRLTDSKIERKVNQTLTKYRHSLQEPLVSRRNGHYVLPVKREHHKKVPGKVWDESATGQTLFIEPADVGELHDELQMWKSVEEKERMIVLADLTELVADKAVQLRVNLEVMSSLDFIYARAKLSRTWDGITVRLSRHPVIKLVDAKHPLLGKTCKPINLSIGWEWRQLIITGPNAGGKTITLKTIGLLTLMVQAGLLIPAEEGTVFGIFEHVLADVGDGQSIEHSLSTFSAHMSAVKSMLDVAGKRSLLLLDELAAGTDPGEGIALSIALLEELLHRGTLVAATTHFNEIKRFAAHTPDCINARMAFDPLTLQSLYRLEIGEAGDSFAFEIARRFGLPTNLIERAEQRLVRSAAGHTTNTVNEQALKLRQPGIYDEEDEAAEGRSEELLVEDAEASQETQHKNGLKRQQHCKQHMNQEKHLGELSEQRMNQEDQQRRLRAGDEVWISLLKCTGIIEQEPNSKGEVIVQTMGKKLTLNIKQLILHETSM